MLDSPFNIPKVPWQKYYIDYYHGGLNGEYVFERNIKNIVRKCFKRIRFKNDFVME